MSLLVAFALGVGCMWLAVKRGHAGRDARVPLVYRGDVLELSRPVLGPVKVVAADRTAGGRLILVVERVYDRSWDV